MRNYCEKEPEHEWRWWSKGHSERYCAMCGLRRSINGGQVDSRLQKKKEFARYLHDMSLGRVETLRQLLSLPHLDGASGP